MQGNTEGHPAHSRDGVTKAGGDRHSASTPCLAEVANAGLGQPQQMFPRRTDGSPGSALMAAQLPVGDITVKRGILEVSDTKPSPTFDGTRPWPEFQRLLDDMAEEYHWPERKKYRKLYSSLRGREATLSSYNSLTAAMRVYFTISTPAITPSTRLIGRLCNGAGTAG